jgi:hypothetical protein
MFLLILFASALPGILLPVVPETPLVADNETGGS